MAKKHFITPLLFCLVFAGSYNVKGQTNKNFHPGGLWTDNNGVHINAHGGGILFHEGRYYWFGEHKGENSNDAFVGVTCYSSYDLYNWKYEGIALSVENDPASDITSGSIIERPKVIYNLKTGKFVMYFHLELKGKGYSAARVGIAISNSITGPYSYLKSLRPNAGRFPENMTEAQRKATEKPADYEKWWTPEWYKAVNNGMFVRRDLQSGQMSRDMTLFVDDDGKAWHIYASEENLTMQIAELTDDYLNYTGKYFRIAPVGHNEAPAIFKKDGRYFMITSGCTGWEPNAARLFTADSIFGPWIQHPSPCIGDDADLTFHSQSTFILPVAGNKDAFIFMADRWMPHKPIDGRYVWLPIQFENNLPSLKWKDEWDLSIFDTPQRQSLERYIENNSDREYWTNVLYQMAEPVLTNMSKGELKKNMQVEVSPTWDGRSKNVAYMETFGRLMVGLAPWLALPDDSTPEGVHRKKLRDLALKSYAQAVNPESPDYLLWKSEGQPLVDAAFIANSFLRAPEQLWKPLDDDTKKKYVEELKQLRRIDPPYSNWLLFSAMIETFLAYVDEDYDKYRIHSAIRKMEEWYVGDGWYADGERFAFDYYNSYVIQPMYVEILEVLVIKQIQLSNERLEDIKKKYATALFRMQRYSEILERFISPEGTFPVFGRSITYRLAVFQPLALLSLRKQLPESLSEGQVRAGMTACMKRMFSEKENFNNDGFLQLGFAGHQPYSADSYTNNGSLYLTSLAFLPLGLPAEHSFWTSPDEYWTSKKAWEGKSFSKDKAIKE